MECTPTRAAPDEASRAPTPISDGQLRQWLIELAGCETVDAAIVHFRALLAQSQGGQPATSREQGDDALTDEQIEEVRRRHLGSKPTLIPNNSVALLPFARAIAELRKGDDPAGEPQAEGKQEGQT